MSQMTRYPLKGFLHLSGWHGVTKHSITILGRTPKRYRVRIEERMRLPSKRIGNPGDVVLVPLYSVTIETQSL